MDKGTVLLAHKEVNSHKLEWRGDGQIRAIYPEGEKGPWFGGYTLNGLEKIGWGRFKVKPMYMENK